MDYLKVLEYQSNKNLINQHIDHAIIQKGNQITKKPCSNASCTMALSSVEQSWKRDELRRVRLVANGKTLVTLCGVVGVVSVAWLVW